MLKDSTRPAPPAQLSLALPDTVLHWQRTTVLDPELLRALHEVNRGYLEIWSGLQVPPSALERRRILPLFVGRLRRTDVARRSEAACCPFALFSARFNDGALWAALAAGAARSPAALRIADGGRPRAHEAMFAETALFYAWHLVRSHPLAARVFLGMSDAVADCFLRLSLPRLSELARQQPGVVRPRWPERRAFWQTLLGQARDAGRRMHEVRQLGVQMIAAEVVQTPARRRPEWE